MWCAAAALGVAALARTAQGDGGACAGAGVDGACPSGLGPPPRGDDAALLQTVATRQSGLAPAECIDQYPKLAFRGACRILYNVSAACCAADLRTNLREYCQACRGETNGIVKVTVHLKCPEVEDPELAPTGGELLAAPAGFQAMLGLGTLGPAAPEVAPGGASLLARLGRSEDECALEDSDCLVHYPEGNGRVIYKGIGKGACCTAMGTFHAPEICQHCAETENEFIREVCKILPGAER